MWTPDPKTFITAEQKAEAAAAAMGSAINAERQRRIEAGETINGVHVTGRDEDTRNLTNLALGAQLRLASGDTETTITFRDGSNADHDLTPVQILALWQQSSEFVSSLYAASWALKAMDPIPVDFIDDKHWQKETTT